MFGEHAPENAMVDPDEIERFYDRCSDLMRELLDALAAAPDRPRPFPEIEDAIGWPRRRIASVLGGVCRLRQMEFSGRRPYRFHEPRWAATGRWEMWMDGDQARALLAPLRSASVGPGAPSGHGSFADGSASRASDRRPDGARGPTDAARSAARKI